MVSLSNHERSSFDPLTSSGLRTNGALQALVVTAAVLALTGAGNRPKISPEEKLFAQERKEMVIEQIQRHGVTDKAVLKAMEAVPRHLFVPRELQQMAYMDTPLPIGEGQTISQPYVVALMTELAEIKPGEKVLEIGTGSGYQAAVLAELTDQVFTIEILPNLAAQAQHRLQALGYTQVHPRTGDGTLGWPEEAPFDAILVTAAPKQVPEALLDQLAEGGVLVAPVGERGYQQLRLIRKKDGKIVEDEETIPVSFVPMVRGQR